MNDGLLVCLFICLVWLILFVNDFYLPKNVPIVVAMLRPIAPPDNESKLALRAQAHALVPAQRKEKKRTENEHLFIVDGFFGWNVATANFN